MLEQFFISSSLGILEICVKQNKLYSVSRVNPTSVRQPEILKIMDKNRSYILGENSRKTIKQQKLSVFAGSVKTQIKNYFGRRLKRFDIPLFARGTNFQKKVWKSLRKIPWGQTKTYGQLATQLKIPKGARAIGNCCAKNPFLLVVPCHRVLSHKDLGGFALGLKAKRRLLSLEQIGFEIPY